MKYLFDDAYRANNNWPGRIEDVWPIDASGPYVVSPDDRITVLVFDPSGSPNYLFDGFAQIPQADITPSSEHATFTAVGVAAREFDNPISGRTQRNGDPTGIQTTDGTADIGIDLPCRFNPADSSYGDDGGYQPNKTPNNYDTTNANTTSHPVFVDERIKGRATGSGPDYWTVSDCIKYILAEYNPALTYTNYPAPATLDDLLGTVSTDGPISPAEVLSSPFVVRDYDASNKPWPEAVAELLGYVGFVMRWDLESDQNGLPQTYLRFYRRDMLSTSPVRKLYLDTPGNSLANGSRNNVTALHLARDSNSIVNAWQVETQQKIVEISVLLAPLFQPAVADAAQSSPGDSTSGRDKFLKSKLTKNNASAADWRKYRWWGVDELGEGYWSDQSAQWKTGTPFDFSTVFPADDDGTPSYVRRYRPGLGHLVSLDDKKKPLAARLDISFGNTIDGPQFGVDGDTTKWFPVTGGWSLLPDRLGIMFDGEDPNAWKGFDKSVRGGVILGNEWWSNPGSSTITIDSQTYNFNSKPPTFRLTVAIQDDLRMPITAGKRKGSPTKYARWRVADARDHFQYLSIDPSSANYRSQGGNGNGPVPVRDDTDAADAHARALRSAHEMPPLAGSVTLPGLCYSYEIGDRVAAIVGRDISLAQSAAASSGEAVSLPIIVGREFHTDGQFRTVLHLSDLRALKHDNAY